jgi:hypothetical protein
MPQKTYGLTEEEKKRKAEFQKEEYEKLPWHIPIQYWESVELNTYNTARRNHSIKELDAIEKKIKERIEN